MNLYVLRLYGTNHFFAGFKPTEKIGVFQPIFVEAGVERAPQVNLVHENDLPETEKDLKKFGIVVERQLLRPAGLSKK